MFVFLGSKTHEMDVLRRKCSAHHAWMDGHLRPDGRGQDSSAHHAWMDGQADLVLCNHLAFRPPCVDGRHLLHSYNFIAWIDGECKNPVQEFSSHSR